MGQLSEQGLDSRILETSKTSTDDQGGGVPEVLQRSRIVQF